MIRRVVRVAAVLAIVGATAACNSGTTAPSPSPPAPTPITENPFTGTLSVNGAASQPFNAGIGSVTATIATLDPGEAVVVGFYLGVWNGFECQVSLPNDNATVGTALTGSINAAGVFCARIYDVGKLTEPVTFTINIVHF